MIVIRKLRAFTLVELIVTLSIAAILIAWAAPSFSTFIKNNRLTTQINDLSSAVNMARSEAIKRADTVVLCASNDQSSCNGTGWEQGWIVYSDNNDNGVIESSEIVLVHEAIPNNMTLVRNIASTDIVIESSGYAKENEMSTFVLCDDRGSDYAKGLVFSLNGRPKMVQATSISSCS